jgi:hypothetical protein
LKRKLFRVVTLTGVTLGAITCVELITRRMDGYALRSWPLVRLRLPEASIDGIVEAYVDGMAVTAGVSRTWFADDPEEHTGGSSSPDPDLSKRAVANPGREAASNYQWNVRFLHDSACERDSPRHTQVVSGIFPVENLFVFEPVGGSPFPRFRFLPNAHYPSGLITNSFGWRGPEVPLNKPDDRIRVAFVGASTTVAPHAYRYSYPDHIRRWLHEWSSAWHPEVKFDVINAAREGIDSTSIAAIVGDELVPIRPDLVVYYEGANQFGPADFIVWPRGVVPSKPVRTGTWPLESTSALVRRLRAVRDPFTVRREEPIKPRLPVAWPADLDERDPRLDHPRLPSEQPTILRDLDAMREALSKVDGRLVVSSFVWCVKEGLQLEPTRDAGVYGYLNDMFWPFSYAYMRRLADFQNRVLQKYARSRDLDFIDVAARYPIDPRLFIDGVHMTPNGTKLMAWITFQRLVTILDRLIAESVLPHHSHHRIDRHPAFADSLRRLAPVAAIRGTCTSS